VFTGLTKAVKQTLQSLPCLAVVIQLFWGWRIFGVPGTLIS